MPLDEPYRQFRPGDLVYGLEVPRARYMTTKFKGGLVIEQFHVLRGEDSSDWPAAPGQMLRGFMNALRDHPVWKEAIGKEMTNANIRMKDKGGLWWATRCKIYVNYILDDIDMEDVVGKSHQGRKFRFGETDEVRAVTGSELRWIYRHDWISEVRQYIQFWYSDRPVCAPWKTYYTIDYGTIGNATNPEDALKANDGAALW